MLKVFMGGDEEPAEQPEAEDEERVETPEADAKHEANEIKLKEEFNPLNVMKKALSKESFAGLVVVD
jgi:hypothetical protein